MTSPNDPVCSRMFAHTAHRTVHGACPGLSAQERTTQLAEHAAEARAAIQHTECPHAGCAHDAATPDAAHHMDPDLVASLQALGAHHGPRGLQLALAALWPELATAAAASTGAAPTADPPLTRTVTLTLDSSYTYLPEFLRHVALRSDDFSAGLLHTLAHKIEAPRG